MSIILRMNNNKFILRFSFFILASLLSIVAIIAQQDGVVESAENTTIAEDKKVEVYSATREELHRYMGYEELLPKYFSLPYDVAMNTNIGGPFLDISYLFLLFLPILILFGIKNKMLKIATVGLMLLFMIISLPSGYRSNKIVRVDEVGVTLSREIEMTPFMSMPLAHIKLQLTQVANSIYLPIHHNLINAISGEGDAVTYPIFFLLFCLVFFILRNRMKDTSKLTQILAYFFLVYCFLWLILGAGVIWYGLLMLPLGLIFVGIDAMKKRKKTNFFKYAFFLFGSFWMICALTYRLGNYTGSLNDEQKALGGTQKEWKKGAVFNGTLLYGLGRINKSGLVDILFPAYGDVLTQINSQPDALVYRIGTYFQYFISENNERVLEDNQLAFFDNTYNLVPDKLNLVQVLKDQGYRYLIVDYKVASIDRTPDESLRKKARRFEQFLRNNDALQIIGTDRVVLNSNGQRVYGVAGSKLISSGTFVAYKIR